MSDSGELVVVSPTGDAVAPQRDHVGTALWRLTSAEAKQISETIRRLEEGGRIGITSRLAIMRIAVELAAHADPADLVAACDRIIERNAQARTVAA